MIAQGRSNERTAWKESETHVGRFDVRVRQALLPGVVGGRLGAGVPHGQLVSLVATHVILRLGNF